MKSEQYIYCFLLDAVHWAQWKSQSIFFSTQRDTKKENFQLKDRKVQAINLSFAACCIFLVEGFFIHGG